MPLTTMVRNTINSIEASGNVCRLVLECGKVVVISAEPGVKFNKLVRMDEMNGLIGKVFEAIEVTASTTRDINNLVSMSTSKLAIYTTEHGGWSYKARDFDIHTIQIETHVENA
jgi:hypothetical protein